jgi:putative transposase
VHMLVEGSVDASYLPAFASLAKQYSGYSYRDKSRGPLWQDGYYDHVLRDSESTRKVARYIIENPIRANIVQSVWLYPFIGSSKYTREQLIEWAYSWEPEPDEVIWQG